jgi:hypothetical protein
MTTRRSDRMRYEIKRENGTTTVTTQDEELGNYLESDLATYEEFERFHRELEELPAPTPDELEIINSNRYDRRVERLKILLTTAPNERAIVAACCRSILSAVYGSRDRAITEWIRDTVSPEDTKKEGKQ